MGAYVIRKLLYGIAVLWGVATLVFFLFNILPGDPAQMMLGQRADEASVNAIREELGMNQSLGKQYVDYLNDLVPISFYDVSKGTQKLDKIGIGGVIGISDEGKDILGIPVPEGMVGIAIVGGITPFRAVQENGEEINIKIAEEITDFKTLSPITSTIKNQLKPATHDLQPKISFVLSKSWNLIQQVDFDVEKRKGNIVANISYLQREDLDKALEIMEDAYNKDPKHINPYYKVVNHPTDDDKVGIATICSLSIDGILINNGIICNPKYGGLLELTEPSLFIDLISYNGSTVDPHKIFIAKDMTAVAPEIGPKKILASFKEIPYISRDYAVELLDTLDKIGFSIYKIGKPRELAYNAKADNYNFGIVAGSGLNLIAAVREKGVDIHVKAIEKLMPFEKMERL